MGRRKKPADLHRIHGTDKPGKMNYDAPEIEAVSNIEKLARPLWLDADAVAAWDELLPILIRMGVFTIADQSEDSERTAAIRVAPDAQISSFVCDERLLLAASRRSGNEIHP